MVTYQVFVKDKQTRVIRPSQEHRQDDPLYPSIFILVADVLSRMIEKQVVAGWIDGIKPNNGFSIIHHLFSVNDSILFISGSVEKAMRLWDVIEQYYRASGQKVNFSKFSLFFNSAKKEDIKREVTEVFFIQQVLNPGLYLGLPTI